MERKSNPEWLAQIAASFKQLSVDSSLQEHEGFKIGDRVLPVQKSHTYETAELVAFSQDGASTFGGRLLICRRNDDCVFFKMPRQMKVA